MSSFIITANPIAAQKSLSNYSVGAEEPLTVRYLGNDGAYLLFEVTVRSTDRQIASLDIIDKVEGELFASSFRSDLKVQKIKIERRDNQLLDFKLGLGKSTFIKSFNVKNSTVENTTVSENHLSRL